MTYRGSGREVLPPDGNRGSEGWVSLWSEPVQAPGSSSLTLKVAAAGVCQVGLVSAGCHSAYCAEQGWSWAAPETARSRVSGWTVPSCYDCLLSTSLLRSQELAKHKTAAWLLAPFMALQRLSGVVPGLGDNKAGPRPVRPRI